MKALIQFDKILRRIENALSVGSWAVTLFITFMIVTDVCLRYFFNKPLPASWEISEVIMPYIVFFALSRALSEGVHVKVALVTGRLRPNLQLIFNIFSNLFGFLVCLFVTYCAWKFFWQSFIIREEILAAIKIPWWLGKLAMPIGFGMFGLRYIITVVLDYTEHTR